jgi:hypothetical protein
MYQIAGFIAEPVILPARICYDQISGFDHAVERFLQEGKHSQ